jgi:hypothetical protein
LLPAIGQWRIAPDLIIIAGVIALMVFVVSAFTGFKPAAIGGKCAGDSAGPGGASLAPEKAGIAGLTTPDGDQALGAKALLDRMDGQHRALHLL